jgi:hypothetical protein
MSRINKSCSCRAPVKEKDMVMVFTSVRSDIEVREDLFCIPVISEHMAIKKTDFVKDVNEIPNNWYY